MRKILLLKRTFSTGWHQMMTEIFWVFLGHFLSKKAHVSWVLQEAEMTINKNFQVEKVSSNTPLAWTMFGWNQHSHFEWFLGTQKKWLICVINWCRGFSRAQIDLPQRRTGTEKGAEDKFRKSWLTSNQSSAEPRIDLTSSRIFQICPRHLFLYLFSATAG